MLENCAGLEDCERVLAGQVEKVAFLGQVELSPEDVEKLGALIRGIWPKWAGSKGGNGKAGYFWSLQGNLWYNFEEDL